MPAIDRERECQLGGDRQAGRRFELLKRGSMMRNFAQIVNGAAVLETIGG